MCNTLDTCQVAKHRRNLEDLKFPFPKIVQTLHRTVKTCNSKDNEQKQGDFDTEKSRQLNKRTDNGVFTEAGKRVGNNWKEAKKFVKGSIFSGQASKGTGEGLQKSRRNNSKEGKE